jgi:uncharacterized protein YsxB (DUF464 family)
MIIASFFKSDEHIAGFIVAGHAGYAQQGKDIACACVSSAVQMAVNTLIEVAGVAAETKVEDDTVVLLMPQNITSMQQELCDIVLKGLQLQIKLISEEFKGFVKLEL